MKHYRFAIALSLVALAASVLGFGQRLSPLVDWENVSIDGLRPSVTLEQIVGRFGEPRFSKHGYFWERGTGEKAISIALSQEGNVCRLSGTRLMLNGQVIAQGDSEAGRRLVNRLTGERYQPKCYQAQLEKILGPGQPFDTSQAFDTQTHSPKLCTAYDASGRGTRCILLVERILRPHEDEEGAIARFAFVWHQDSPLTTVKEQSLAAGSPF